LLVTPQFHHWHHSARLYNRNFAAHLPVIDRIFGTYHLPGNDWPEEYGIVGNPVPEGYVRQFTYPLVQGKADATSEKAERDEA
jgi:lathosterol oxidase